MSGPPRQTGVSVAESNSTRHDPLGLPVEPQAGGLTAEDSLAVNKALKHRRTAKQKSSIERKSPLGLKPRAKTQLDLQAEKLEALLQAKEATSRLPKQSSYAKHRMACIQKALSLLDMQRYMLLKRSAGPQQTPRKSNGHDNEKVQC
jgi:hypothetical protein